MSSLTSAGHHGPGLGEGCARLGNRQGRKRAFRLIQRRPRFLDIIRTRYVRLPPRVKAPFAPLLAALPMSVRFGATYQRVRESIWRSQADAGFTRDYQATALREVVQRASSRSPHYADLFAAIQRGLEAERFAFDRLQMLPVLTKQEIVANPEDFLIARSGEYDVRTTSGSSGRPPAKVFLDRDRSVREMAFLHHLWSRIGYRLGDRRAILSDYAGLAPVGGRTWP